MLADTLVISTGAVAKRLEFPGAGETDGFWNKGVSACAVRTITSCICVGASGAMHIMNHLSLTAQQPPTIA